MLLLAIFLALITRGAKGSNSSVSLQVTDIQDDSLVKNVANTLGVCTGIVQAVDDFRDVYFTSNESRRLSEDEEVDDEALVQGVKNKLDTCDTIVDAVDAFRKDYEAIFEPEIGLIGESIDRELITLNVGGKLFTTKLATLQSGNTTFFDKMFREGANNTKGEDGAYFIDRDSSTFGYILDYLRNGDLLVKSEAVNIRMQVLDDAEYFELPNELKDYLRWSSVEGIDLWFSEFKFLNKELKLASMELGGLLYQASKDGYSVSTFHSRCDGKGPTLTIVETKSGNVFGGYTYSSWSSSGGYTASSKGFLFRLRPSMKRYNQLSAYTSKAIDRSSSLGPTFGGGHDLYIINCRHVASCATNKHSYNMSSSYELNDGEQIFRIKDYAVVQAKAL